MDETKIAEETVTPTPALEPKAQEEQTPKTEETQVSEEELRKKEHLANIEKAIAEGNKKLKEIRTAIKQVKPQETEELPKIDLDDPSARAWDNRINDTVNPVKAEMEAEKQEIRSFALQDFLADKPALAKDPEKVKELVQVYEKIRTATERTVPGVLTDLRRAYAAQNADNLLKVADQTRVAKAQADATFADPAISRGASSYQAPKKLVPTYDKEQQQILARWSTSPGFPKLEGDES